jgi:ABC-type phosphate transport system permease subunit
LSIQADPGGPGSTEGSPAAQPDTTGPATVTGATPSANGVTAEAAVGYLTCPVWTFYASPYKAQVYLSYDAALLLFVMVLIVIIPGRVVVSFSRRHAE